MVRGNLRLWLGVAAFVVVVATLALIAANRDRGVDLNGRWDLLLVETPNLSAEPEGLSWVEFDEGTLEATGNCFRLMGSYSAGVGGFRMNDWGGESNCPDPVADAYFEYLQEVSQARLVEGTLRLESADGSVRFTYTRAPR